MLKIIFHVFLTIFSKFLNDAKNSPQKTVKKQIQIVAFDVFFHKLFREEDDVMMISIQKQLQGATTKFDSRPLDESSSAISHIMFFLSDISVSP
jgi:hypothetical protein